MMEERVSFNAHSDRMCYGISADNGEMLVEISGYDLRTKFNLDMIRSLDDAEQACAALSNVFLKALCEQLLEESKKSETKSSY